LRDKRLELFPGQGAALDQGIGDNRDKRPLRFKGYPWRELPTN
jgi:hypothetical protein